MNKNKSFWNFLDLKTTKEVKKYINQDKEFIKNTQYSRFNLACHFCKRNEENLFKYLIKNNICKVPTMKASCASASWRGDARRTSPPRIASTISGCRRGENVNIY